MEGFRVTEIMLRFVKNTWIGSMVFQVSKTMTEREAG